MVVTATSYFGETAGYADNCEDAIRKIPSLSSLQGGELNKQEDLILLTCSEGPAGHIVRGDRYERASDLKHATDEYRTALKEITQTGVQENNIINGDRHLLAHKFGKAIEAYQQALKEQPDWTEALLKLADAHVAAGNDDEAIDALRRCIKLDKSNSDARYTLGVVYERKGLLIDAENEFRASLRLRPGNGDAHRHLADIYTIRGDFTQALREYRDLLALHSDNRLCQAPGLFSSACAKFIFQFSDQRASC